MVRDPTLALALTRHHPVHALDVERPLWQVRTQMRTQHADAHATCRCARTHADAHAHMQMRTHTCRCARTHADAHAHAACTCTRGTFLPNPLSLLTHFVPVPLWQARLVPRLEDSRCVLVFLVDHR